MTASRSQAAVRGQTTGGWMRAHSLHPWRPKSHCEISLLTIASTTASRLGFTRQRHYVGDGSLLFTLVRRCAATAMLPTPARSTVDSTDHRRRRWSIVLQICINYNARRVFSDRIKVDNCFVSSYQQLSRVVAISSTDREFSSRLAKELTSVTQSL